MRRRHPPLRGVSARAVTGLALAWALVVSACGPDGPPARSAPESGSPIRIVDDAGVELVLPEPARRIVSLVPSATRTLHDIGAGDALVGRTDYDTLGWARALPSVGQGLEPNMEALVALEPDLVVRFAGTQDPRTPRRLDDLRIPHLAIRPDRVSDIYRITRTLGVVTGHVARADSLAAWIQGSLGQLADRAADLPPRRVAYVLGGTPPWVAGPGTYIDDVLSLAGGQNVFSDLGVLYSAVSPEQLRSRDIEIVLLATEGTLDASLTPGARIAVIGDVLEIPGPGVVEAAYHMAEVLHGMPLR